MALLERNFSIPFTQSRVTYGRLLQAMYCNVFNILKAAKSTLLSGKSDPVFDHHHRNKNVLHNSKWKCNLRLFLLVLSLGTTEKGMTSSSLFPSIIRQLQIDKISLELSLLQDKPSQLSQPLLVSLNALIQASVILVTHS